MSDYGWREIVRPGFTVVTQTTDGWHRTFTDIPTVYGERPETRNLREAHDRMATAAREGGIQP